MKAYTDIEQSKKLAEILPLESADMYYPNRTDIKCHGALPIEYKHGNPLLSQEIAAWSLAGLLDVLNKTAYFMDEDASVDLSSYKTIEWDLGITNSDLELVTESNPVDACYKMIINLHEQKLL